MPRSAKETRVTSSRLYELSSLLSLDGSKMRDDDVGGQRSADRDLERRRLLRAGDRSSLCHSIAPETALLEGTETTLEAGLRPRSGEVPALAAAAAELARASRWRCPRKFAPEAAPEDASFGDPPPAESFAAGAAARPGWRMAGLEEAAAAACRVLTRTSRSRKNWARASGAVAASEAQAARHLSPRRGCWCAPSAMS